MKHAATTAGWIATLALAAVLGWLAAQVRLFEAPWAVAVLAVLIAGLIGFGVHAYTHLWDEDDD